MCFLLTNTFHFIGTVQGMYKNIDVQIYFNVDNIIICEVEFTDDIVFIHFLFVTTVKNICEERISMHWLKTN